MVRRAGLEPTIPCLKGKCLTNLATGANSRHNNIKNIINLLLFISFKLYIFTLYIAVYV